MDTGTLVVVTLIIVVTIIAVGEYIKTQDKDDINEEGFYDRYDDITVEAAKEQKRKENIINDRSLDDYGS